jgi:peptidoglycan/xylan/chitin deacetylase (PgdA/CDA1 family)
MSGRWTVPILTYHRVGELKGDHVPTVTPETFEWQLRFLQRHRFRVIELGDLAEAVAQGRVLGRRTAAVTFDDGYEETFSIAAPLLQRFGVRATVFVTPTEIGTTGFMTWEQVRALAQDGIRIGSHTMHHAYLPLLPPEQVPQELAESKRVLEQQLGQPVPWLSYPVGGFTPQIQALARQAGYRAACTTNRGTSKTAHDLFALRRIKMTDRDRSALLMWVKLSGYYDLFRRLEQPA